MSRRLRFAIVVLGIAQIVGGPTLAFSFHILSGRLGGAEALVQTIDLKGELWRGGMRFEDDSEAAGLLYDMIYESQRISAGEAAFWSLLLILNGAVYVMFGFASGGVGRGHASTARANAEPADLGG